ncbi:dihydrofolate reductase [Allochromatium warmingii]|uniref:Dihydrofolate reductase n=1 Tax=Allochromatium warmingii TaxID=61595 RepID=A0A1H3EI64_ALLWA|nr:dihydrofolate reductase [Allochromatium warmingii]SDX78463.1 dihydrofolate reductase [Allochromatium warmingii]
MKQPQLALVAALDRARVIGRDKQLPWHLPADLAQFKALTLDKPILMGRRTWESLPGLLPRRRHLVISRDPHYQADGCDVFNSLDAALAAVAGAEVMVIGGASLYAQTLPLAKRLYLTLVQTTVAGDTYFPEWNPADWREIKCVDYPADARNAFAMRFVELEREESGQRLAGSW